ncbi:uncharacterized protein [Rutidosis leptorrhynchoides]|uniref:uncharacterized protein n=1 Tax=Rutidosis leptorrhynchoides TaxID=125765 RepID=UPI003A992D19
MSKLDRFLVSSDFLSLWKDLKVVALDRRVSDYCPIILSDGDVNFGPKPFKIFDDWLSVDGIEEVIANSWKGSMEGQEGNRKDCIFCNKLKRLKGDLREWSKSRFENLDIEIKNAKKAALDLELKAEAGNLSVADHENWIASRKTWLDKEKTKTGMLRQKARVRWMTDGDENSKYFHNSLRRNYNKNNIRGINVNGSWCEDPSVIKEEAVNHFKKIFEDGEIDRPSLAGLNYSPISELEAENLELPFSENEVWESVKCCRSTKAPGPDGLFGIFQKVFGVSSKRI